MSRILNSTILLCSATQPTLEATQRKNILMATEPMLIDCKDDFKHLRRVNVVVEGEKDTSSAADFAMAKAKENGNCLIVVNTKKTALEIFNYLLVYNNEFKIFHLSTSMCSAHRIKVINDIKDNIINQIKVVCVSTQLIEAGVDISFACVIRGMSGLDSIAQAAGRCNRNGESIDPKEVYTFRVIDENLDKLPDIKSGRDIASEIIYNQKSCIELLDESILSIYYKRFFAGKDSQMDYPTNTNESIYSMLTGNDYGKQNYLNRTGERFSHHIAHAFDTADKNFNVIDNRTRAVIVPFDGSVELIEKYRSQPHSIYTKEKARLIKKLQRFSVSLYEWQLAKLSENGALTLLDADAGIMLLDSNYYSDEIGIVLEIIQDNLIL